MSQEKDFGSALKDLEVAVKTENKQLIEKSIESLNAEFGEKIQDSSDEIKALVSNQVKEAEEMLTTKFNEFSAKLNEKRESKAMENKGFEPKMKSFISENYDIISKVSKGNGIEFGPDQMKAVANMLTTGDHVTGDYIRDYNFNVVEIPGQKVNVADLVPTINIGGGTYTYIREGAGEGSIAAQTEGSNLSQRDYDYSHIDLATDIIGGRTIYSRKMRNNLQYLESSLPNQLRRDYFIAENAAFNTTLAAAATTSTNLIASVDNIAELVKADIETLDSANYSNTNGVVMNTADWYAILNIEKSTGAGYGLPFGWTYDAASNSLRCLGIPVFKANWVAATKFYVGDFSQVERVVTEGLSLEFSTQERFSLHEIVAKITAQVGLAVKQPASMIIGDTDAV